jgi:hypothetical protein
MYHLTHRMMISWSKCRPLNRSCAEVGSVIPAVIAGCRAFQQFAPELFLVRYILFQMNQQTYARSNNPTNRNCGRYTSTQSNSHFSRTAQMPADFRYREPIRTASDGFREFTLKCLTYSWVGIKAGKRTRYERFRLLVTILSKSRSSKTGC